MAYGGIMMPDFLAASTKSKKSKKKKSQPKIVFPVKQLFKNERKTRTLSDKN